MTEWDNLLETEPESFSKKEEENQSEIARANHTPSRGTGTPSAGDVPNHVRAQFSGSLRAGAPTGLGLRMLPGRAPSKLLGSLVDLARSQVRHLATRGRGGVSLRAPSVDDLKEEALEQGWTIKPSKKGEKWVPPDPTKEIVIVHLTPSDTDANKILLGRLKRSGFIWPPPED